MRPGRTGRNGGRRTNGPDGCTDVRRATATIPAIDGAVVFRRCCSPSSASCSVSRCSPWPPTSSSSARPGSPPDLRVSTVVIGAVVIGFGTSAPELVVSVLAGLQGSLDLAVGNIVGSNVANLTLVLGIAALISPVAVSSPVLRREAPMSLGLVLLFGLLLQSGTLTRLDGLLLFTGLVIALSITLWSPTGRECRALPAAASVQEFLQSGGRLSLPRESIRTALGLLGTLGAAQVLVVSASTVARELGLSEAFIGLTVVAVGTSLPELATAVQAARRHETDLLIGNLLGSNLFNSGAVAAAAAFAGAGQALGPSITGAGTVLMVGVAALATLFMVTGRQVHRFEGLILLTLYVGTLPLLAG
jgi:cation:H+ antiporter